MQGRRVLALGAVCAVSALSGCARPGAPWTIQCMELDGPSRMQHLQQIAETLKRTPGIRADEVRVEDESDGLARLYYGTYTRHKDPKTGRHTMPRQMRDDLDLIKQLAVGDQRLFLRAIPVRTPMPDVGNPDWDLRNVDATYSLQVAAFEATDEFWQYKEAAAKFCEYLRKQGYEAYYYHDDPVSVVTVGAFGPDAVIVDRAGRTYYSDEVRALQEHELLKYNLLNGGIVKVKDNEGNLVPVPSRLVEIPKGE